MLASFLLFIHVACSIAALGISCAVAAGKIMDKRAGLTMLILSLFSGLMLYTVKSTLPEMSALLHVVLYVTTVISMLYGKEVYLTLLKRDRISL